MELEPLYAKMQLSEVEEVVFVSKVEFESVGSRPSNVSIIYIGV